MQHRQTHTNCQTREHAASHGLFSQVERAGREIDDDLSTLRDEGLNRVKLIEATRPKTRIVQRSSQMVTARRCPR